MSGPTPHFSWMELTARKGRPGVDLLEITPSVRAALTRVCEVAEVIRAEVGRPIRVTSGYRHGNGGSQHGVGQALDLQIDGMTPREALTLVRRLDAEGRLPHRLRQVIAESEHAGAASIDAPMGRGSGQWLHVAVMGIGNELYTRPTDAAWLGSWMEDGRRVYPRIPA